MSKETRQFFNQLRSETPPSLVESIKEAASAVKDIGGQLWDGMKPMFDHGRSELAAALFTGQGYVMYMKGQQATEQSQNRDEPAREGQDCGREI